MDASIIVRFLLVLVGIVFMILSAAGAVLEMAKSARKDPKKEIVQSNPLEDITKLIDSIKALWDTFKSAPMWLALAGIGILLILLGALLPFPAWMI